MPSAAACVLLACRFAFLVAILGGSILSCGDDRVTAPTPSSGAARVAVSLSPVDARSVARVAATVSAVDMDTLRQDLTLGADGVAAGLIESIPVGLNRKLELAAYSATGILTHYGFTAGLSVADAETLVVTIALLPLSGAVAVRGAILADNDPVAYTVTFTATWSAATHPVGFPAIPHFSGLVGVLHNSNVTFWQPGKPASNGIRWMAQEGQKVSLQEEFALARENGNAGENISAAGVNPSPGTLNVDFEATRQFPLVTLVTMVAPSPDWFVGSQSLSLLDDSGQWRSEVELELFAYDAGTDGGSTYSAPNQPLDVHLPIVALRDAPFRVAGVVPPMGTFTFVRR